MATNETYIDAPPAAVWAVLADGYAYSEWVVGSDSIRAADHGWPRAGTRIHHRVGRRPLTLSDHTMCLRSVPEQTLVLDARALPLGRARVTLRVRPEGRGTRVTLVEEMAGHTRPLNWLPPVQLLLRVRNVQSLRRLRRLAEQRHGERELAAHSPAAV